MSKNTRSFYSRTLYW